MRYCKRCVQPDTRPNSRFDEFGVCPACNFQDEYASIDWDERRRELDAIVSETKLHNYSDYDCIIGVSGGKDSTRQAMFARDELGLRPLLVCCTYPPEQITELGCANLSNLVSLGFDTVNVSPGPQVWKRLMRNGFFRFGNFGKSTEMALYASAPKIAVAYRIPLIFLGENPAITVGALCTGSTSGDANKMKNTHTLQGGVDVVTEEGVREQELFWYRYSSDEEMQMANLRVVYLGYYIKDFFKVENEKFSVAHGMQIRNDPPEDIGDISGAEALDENFVVVNQMFKFLKFGFGKVTEQVCEEMRLGRMTREEAVRLVKAYDGRCAKRYIESFCEYLEITEKEFWEVAERFRGKDVWEPDGNGGWKLRASIDERPAT